MACSSPDMTQMSLCPFDVTVEIAPGENPVAIVSSTKWSSSNLARPWLLHAQIIPLPDSASDLTSFPGSPLAVVNVFTPPSFHRASPSPVPIHSEPSEAARRHCTSLPGKAGVDVLSNT